MSKVILICSRTRIDESCYRSSLRILADRLAPDNISPRAPRIKSDNKGLLIAVVNPGKTLAETTTSVCLGLLINPRTDWWQPGAEAPDGSYALFRADDNYVELLTDAVASRTIWYTKTDDLFLVSSSQRAIVSFIKEFKPNYEAFLWMLSSGTLGPGHAWDSRIHCLGADARLCLNRHTWQVSHQATPVIFKPADVTFEEHEAQLKKALIETVENAHLDLSRWVLPLSGGYDSRGLLLLLNRPDLIQTITWGLKSSLTQQNSDAFVALALARRLNIRHRYFELDGTDVGIDTAFERFLALSEGRTDDIAGYTDGLCLWETLFDEGVLGVIRGDEGFGWKPARNRYQVRASIGATPIEDLWQLNEVANLKMKYLGEQTWPESFRWQDSESLATWRDRLYHQWRIPFKLAALNELKAAYIEVANPFLTRHIIQVVRTLPDLLRTNKKLFKRIVERLSPEIDFAKHPSTFSRWDILKRRKVVQLIMDEVSSSYAKSLLPSEFLNRIGDRLTIVSSNWANKRPSVLEETTWAAVSVLAFRVYVICKMNRLLSVDASALSARAN